MKDFLQVDPGFARHLRRLGLGSFQTFFRATGGEVVAAHAWRNATRLDLRGMVGYLKREYRVYWRDYFASWWAGWGFVSKSRREGRTLEELRKRGIPCPRVMAVGENGGKAFLLVKELPASVNLTTYLNRGYVSGDSERRALACQLGRAIARMHNAGFTHPDLYAKHVFVNLHDATVSFVDFQRTRLSRTVRWRRRWHDLAALDASLAPGLVSAQERLVCLAAYLRETQTGGGRRRLWRLALWGIARRSQHLLGQQRVRDMRRGGFRSGEDEEVRSFRAAFQDDRPPRSFQAVSDQKEPV